ncbi:MAG: bacillithiol system redox-active protein YtxJ [Acidobacteriota bacterium]|nr:bacillithiol system redox-active protein YtxJ [Acidobacteriota bacterium]MDH3522366.1 bacillithiol system redox-active protein YtxJ [Acidobacteriota bacterium]
MGQIHEISTPEDLLDELLASHERDVWILKHSRTCGISSAARREFESFASGHRGARFCMVEVQPARAASLALAERLGVRHESPQVILVRRGAAVWHASHWSITRQALGRAGS